MRLIVKHFGPLKDIDIELKKINVFIGENGSGKSVLAKLIATLTDMENLTEEGVKNNLRYFQIDYCTDKTYIKLDDTSNENYFIEVKDKHFAFGQKLSNLVRAIGDSKKLMNLTKEMLDSNFKNYFGNKQYDIEKLFKALEKNPEIDIKENSDYQFNSKDEIIEAGNKLTGEGEKIFFAMKPNYIPAERNVVSLLSRSLGSLIAAEIPLPKFLISFISDFEKARNEIGELNLLNVRYVNSGQDKIYFNADEYIELEQSSSGIQSALPLYLTVQYFMEKRHTTVLIEEPEQNLFPKAQKETVEYIIEHTDDQSSVFMMTHSPYILTALNNLILANDVREQKGDEAIKNLVEQKHCVKFEEVSAYTITDGCSMNILDHENRLVGVNVIDAISDEVSETFDALLAKLD